MNAEGRGGGSEPLRIIGRRSSPDAYAIRDFLTRNRVVYRWVDAGDEDAARATLGGRDLDASRLPVCVLPDGTRLWAPSVEEVAYGIGLGAPARLSEYDLTIVGAGPAGLAAAVYAASEGLRTVVVERAAPGGQAGTSSRIENYLGFPEGIGGAELAERARKQAERFGAEILLVREVVGGGESEDGTHVSELSDGGRIAAPAVLCASGVEWRRLEVPGVEEFLHRGVYYGAGASEAPGCLDEEVFVVGGGNSAGQAALNFARYARRVTMLVRGESLAGSLSDYLLKRIEAAPNVRVLTRTRVSAVDGDERLRTVTVSDRRVERRETLPADALFVCIGGEPRTEWARGQSIALDGRGYLLTGPDLFDGGRARPDGWPLKRDPLPLETNVPGLFAAGDVRHGSTKRVSSAVGEGAMAVKLVHGYLEAPGGA